jgi:hypothetical protein
MTYYLLLGFLGIMLDLFACSSNNLIPFVKMPCEDFIERSNETFMGWYILHQVVSLLWL